MIKNCFMLLMLAVCNYALASQPSPVHLHEIKLVGILPEPYKTFVLEIKLEEATDNVVAFNLFRGSEKIELSDKELSKLKSIKLDTLDVSHEIYREEGKPAESMYGDKGDWLYISAEFGKKYRAEKKRNDKDVFRWGWDSVMLIITKDKTITIDVIKLTEKGGLWHDKTW